VRADGTEITDQPREAFDPQPDVSAGRTDRHPLDQRPHNPRLLGREQLAPQRIQPLQRPARLVLGQVGRFGLRGAPRSNDDLGLGELHSEGFDLALTGFGEEELAGFLLEPTAGLTDPDEVPAPPDIPVSRPGDVWVLGRHRIVCGDSTDPVAVEAVLAGVRPHLMVTDPPYGVLYDPAWRNAALPGANTARIGKVLNDHRADWSEAWALFPGDVAYVWHGALHATTVAESLTTCGFEIRAQIVWAKKRLVMGRGHCHWQHEPCWYAVRGGATGHWSGDRKQTTLWSIPSRDQDATTTHGTQKPVECMRRPIENNSSPGQAVYEPFSGSGTTVIAAEMSGRACHAVELSPAYVDVAVLRWEAFTGQLAVLKADGASYGATAAQRAAEGTFGPGATL
jgi:DNA modification methylase